jgi:hypothetical protein
VEKGKGLKLLAKPQIVVTLPEDCDAAMIRDGVEKQHRQQMGAKAWWLREMIAVVPPSRWTAEAGMTPAELVGAVGSKHEWRAALLGGWSEAAVRYGDEAWAAALLTLWPKQRGELDAGRLVSVLPGPAREAFLLQLLTDLPSALYDDSEGTMLLWQCPPPWSAPLGRLVLTVLRKRISDNRKGYDWYLLNSLPQIARHLPLSMVEEASRDWPRDHPKWQWWDKAVDEMISTLHFRAEMDTALRET